jgi:hypothetical protein
VINAPPAKRRRLLRSTKQAAELLELVDMV